MKIKFKKFDKGIFFLDYMDEDLLSESLDVKLISYTPNSVTPFNFKVDIPSLSGVDKSILSNFIDMKLPREMNANEISYMLSDVSINKMPNKNCIYELEYAHKLSPTDIGTFIAGSGLEGWIEVNSESKGSVTFIMDGLELEFRLSSYRVQLFSSFKVIGFTNSLINFYLEIIGRFIQYSLEKFGIKFAKYN